MDSSYIIAALALMTIGGTLVLAVFHFGFHLKDPKNLEAVKRVAADRESATTKMSSGGSQGRSLRQRLDNAPSVDDSLSSRKAGMTLVDSLTTKWSNVRETLRGTR